MPAIETEGGDMQILRDDGHEQDAGLLQDSHLDLQRGRPVPNGAHLLQ